MASKAAMAVIRYPYIKKPKNYDAAVTMVQKVLGDWRGSLVPKLPFPPPDVHNPRDVIAIARQSSTPEIRDAASTMEKNLSSLEERVRASKGPSEKDLIFPIDLWKTVLPPVYVDAYKQYLDKRYEAVWERSDALPVARLYVDYLEDELPKLTQQFDTALAEYKQLVPEIDKLERRRKAFENNEITIEALFAENPEIAAEIAEELERGDWSVEGNGNVEDEHHHH